MKELIKVKAKVNATNNFDRTPLHQIMTNIGDIQKIQTLIDAGADIHLKDNEGLTPLHLACFCGQVQCLPILLNLNAKVNATDNSGQTPLHKIIHSKSEQKENIAELLLQAGADINIKDKSGCTPLQHLISLSTQDKNSKLFTLLSTKISKL